MIEMVEMGNGGDAEGIGSENRTNKARKIRKMLFNKGFRIVSWSKAGDRSWEGLG